MQQKSYFEYVIELFFATRIMLINIIKNYLYVCMIFIEATCILYKTINKSFIGMVKTL